MEIRTIKYNSEDYFKEQKLRNRVLRIPLGLNLFDENMENEISDIHIGAFKGNILTGILLLTPVDDKIVKMRQVGVDTDYQNLGIGTSLVQFSETLAIDRGYKKITMHARKTAVDFYIKLGYETIGEEFSEVSIPHFKLTKNLD